MKPLALGFYMCLAYCVYSAPYSGMAEFSQAASSAYVPSAMGFGEWNSGTASGVKWAPGLERYFEGLQKGQTLRFRYNRQDKVLSADPQATEGRRMLHDRKMHQVSQSSKEFETTTLIAPSQPVMSHTYTEEELHHIANEVNKKTDGLHYQYHKGTKTLSEAEKSIFDISGFFGRIQVFDSEDPDQLIYETCCCHCRHLRKPGECNLAESCVGLALMSTPIALCYRCEDCISLYKSMPEAISEKLESVHEGLSLRLKSVREEFERRRAMAQIHPGPSP